MDYVEADHPFSKHARFNLTTSLEDQILKLQVSEDPSKAFVYRCTDQETTHCSRLSWTGR